MWRDLSHVKTSHGGQIDRGLTLPTSQSSCLRHLLFGFCLISMMVAYRIEFSTLKLSAFIGMTNLITSPFNPFLFQI